MNINFLVQPEKGNVVVSDEHGNMTYREYQDNIKDVLFLEDIVEGLEKDFNKLNEDIEETETNIIDIESEIIKPPAWQKRANKIYFLEGIGILSFAAFLGYVLKVPDLKFNVLEQLQNPDVLNSTLSAAGIGLLGNGCLFGCIYKLRKGSRKENQTKLENAEIEIKNLKLELFFTKHILFEYKKRLMYELQKKQKSNLQNISTEIQEVSYSETLKDLRDYIKKLYQKDKGTNQEMIEDNQVLGRFKKI